jgi:hypothetical protein
MDELDTNKIHKQEEVVRLDLVEGTTTSIIFKKIIKNKIHKKSEVIRLDLVEGTTIFTSQVYPCTYQIVRHHETK